MTAVCAGPALEEIPMAPEKVEHVWPLPGEHMFTEWRQKTSTTLYRACIHPDCKHTEEKPYPKGV